MVLESFPDGYQTVLGEDGKGISLGQAQRISLAPALIRNSPILILDEPTASLDPESESLILDALQEESKKCICIMVIHGKEAYSRCNKLFIMNNGSIYIQGYASDLLNYNMLPTLL